MPLINHTYRHYKGGLYKVIALGKHADDASDQVVYQGLKDDKVWIRRLDEWNESVDGKPRFELMYR